MGLSLLDEFEVQYHVIKSNEFQTYDGAKVKVFARFESESARRRHCLCSRPAPTSLVEIFTGPSTTTGTRSNDGEGDDFFFYLQGSFDLQNYCLGTRRGIAADRGRPAVGFVYISNGKLVHFIFSLWPFSS